MLRRDATLLFVLSLCACAKPKGTDGTPPYDCLSDEDCRQPVDLGPPPPESNWTTFLRPETVTCRLRDHDFGACSECDTDADCPTGAICTNGVYCRYPEGSAGADDAGVQDMRVGDATDLIDVDVSGSDDPDAMSHDTDG